MLDDIVNHLIAHNIVFATDSSKILFEESKTFLDPDINFLSDIDPETSESLRKAYGTGGYAKYWRTLQIKVSEAYEEFKPDGLEEYIKKEAREYKSIPIYTRY